MSGAVGSRQFYEAKGDSECDSGDEYKPDQPGHKTTRKEAKDLLPSKKRAPTKEEPPAKVLDGKDFTMLTLFRTLNLPWVQNLVWQLRTSQHFRGLRLMGRPAAWESLLSTDVVADYGRVHDEVYDYLDTLNAIEADGCRDQYLQLYCVCSQAEIDAANAASGFITHAQLAERKQRATRSMKPMLEERQPKPTL